MAGIWNINSVNNIEARKILRKLSFTVGENFLARVVNLDKVSGEVLLKLLDGWQFSAKLQKPLDNLSEGLLRFEVEGFEDGKLQIKILNDTSKEQNLEKNTIDSLLKEKGISVSKDDYVLLNKMIKHEIPLTKENISNIKTLVDFRNKIISNEEEENAFIMKYIESKNIDANSSEGLKVKDTLKAFFNELKNISEDDIVTLFENNVDLTEENIKSFNDIFKGSAAIYKDIKGKLVNAINQGKDLEKVDVQNKQANIKAVGNDVVILKNEETLDTSNNKANTKAVGNYSPILESEELLDTPNKQVNAKDVDNNLVILKDEEKLDSKELINNKQSIISNDAEKEKNNLLDKNSNEIKVSVTEKDKNILDKTIKNSIDELAKNIKDQISAKTEEIKSIVKTVLEQKNEIKPEAYNNLIQALDKSINDFKVYNTISNQYYYLDLPINLNSHEYECKLMIKDERKKGKKIDSTDVKIAASVNTMNMGTVDAYIKVNNSKMDVDIKCDSHWIKLLDIGKEKILNDLSDMGYNVYIKVGEREKEMNITNCREFFGDNNLGMINVKV